MVDVAGARNSLAEGFSTRLRHRRFRRRLSRVYVPVTRSWMMWIAGKYAFQYLVNPTDVRRFEILETRPSARRRARPRFKVKQRVGIQRPDVQIVGVSLVYLCQCPRVGVVLRATIRWVEVLDVPLCQC